MDTQNRYDRSFEGELRRYILGEQTEQEEEGFVRRLMTASDESLREVEELVDVLQDEIVGEYLSGRLAIAQRTAFELRLLPSRKIREKLAVEKALRVAAPRKRSPAERLGAWIRPILRPAPAWAFCATLLLVAGGSWSLYHIAMLQGRLDEAVSGQTALTASHVSTPSRTPAEFRGAIASAVILKPGLVRSGGETAQVTIVSGQELVELRLDVGVDEYPRYRAALHDSSDSELIRVSNLRAVLVGTSVQVIVQSPAQVLRADDYRIRLSGMTASGEAVLIDSYPFRVVRNSAPH